MDNRTTNMDENAAADERKPGVDVVGRRKTNDLGYEEADIDDWCTWNFEELQRALGGRKE